MSELQELKVVLRGTVRLYAESLEAAKYLVREGRVVDGRLFWREDGRLATAPLPATVPYGDPARTAVLEVETVEPVEE